MGKLHFITYANGKNRNTGLSYVDTQRKLVGSIENVTSKEVVFHANNLDSLKQKDWYKHIEHFPELNPSDLQETTITLDESAIITPILNFDLPKKVVEVEKAKIAVKKAKNNFNQHLLSHREKYAVVVGLLGIIILVKSFKK